MNEVKITSKIPEDSIEVYQSTDGHTRLYITDNDGDQAEVLLHEFSTDDLTLIINALCGYVLSRTGEGVGK